MTSRPQLERHLREVFAAPERVDAGVLDHHYRVSHRPEARRTFAAYLRGELDVSPGALREAFSRLDRPALLLWGRHAVLPPVAVGGTWLTLNADNSYYDEIGWGYYDDALGGTFVGTGGGVSRQRHSGCRSVPKRP